MKNHFPTLACILLLLTSCTENDPTNWKIDKERINELLSLSSSNIVIDGTTLELHAYLWRDFMPISPPDGKSLISINWLLNTDSVSIPDYIVLSKQFVINGDSIWTSDYTDELRETPNYLIERISRNGPKWGPNIEVTIVAKVINLNNNSEHYLRRDNQLIERTD